MNQLFQNTVSYFKNKDKLLLFIWSFSTCIMACAVLHHESWRDEAQAWLLIRDQNFMQLMNTLKSEGHPPLWYLIVMPFVKLNFPYLSQNFISALFIGLSNWIILFHTNLPKPFKYILPFSYFFIFEYSVLARSYSIATLLTISLAALFHKRADYLFLNALLIALLMMTHYLLMPLACMLLYDHLKTIREQKIASTIRYILLPLIAICIAGYLLSTSETRGYFSIESDLRLNALLNVISMGLFADKSYHMAILGLLGITYLFYKDKSILRIFIFSILGLLYICCFKIYPFLRHAGFIYLLIIACSIMFYNSKEKTIAMERTLQYVLITLIVIQLPIAFKTLSEDYSMQYSGSKEVSEYILNQQLDKKTLVGNQAWAVSSISPYLDKNISIYYPESNSFGTYYRYDTNYLHGFWAYPAEFAINPTLKKFGKEIKSCIFILNRPLPDAYVQDWQLLFQNTETPVIKDEKFYLYKVKDHVEI